MKKKTRTALLTPLQVKEAIISWARYSALIAADEEVDYSVVELRKDGSAAIKKVLP